MGLHMLIDVGLFPELVDGCGRTILVTVHAHTRFQDSFCDDEWRDTHAPLMGCHIEPGESPHGAVPLWQRRPGALSDDPGGLPFGYFEDGRRDDFTEVLPTAGGVLPVPFHF